MYILTYVLFFNFQITHLDDFKFWKIFEGLTKKEMRKREKAFEYPPRLRIECVHIDPSKSLCSSFSVSKKPDNTVIGRFSLVKQVTGIYVNKMLNKNTWGVKKCGANQKQHCIQAGATKKFDIS